MKQWLEEGKLKAEETLYTGIEAWPEAFGSLFSGAHTGKAVLLL
jgi:NADPH-dependent curcumin reductase CurA